MKHIAQLAIMHNRPVPYPCYLCKNNTNLYTKFSINMTVKSIDRYKIDRFVKIILIQKGFKSNVFNTVLCKFPFSSISGIILCILRKRTSFWPQRWYTIDMILYNNLWREICPWEKWVYSLQWAWTATSQIKRRCRLAWWTGQRHWNWRWLFYIYTRCRYSPHGLEYLSSDRNPAVSRPVGIPGSDKLCVHTQAAALYR